MSTAATAVHFETSDGVGINGDLAIPESPVGAAIVCHPHPQFGGNRFNPVVTTLHNTLADLGVASLRFDFRAQFDDGRGELLDAEAALAFIRDRVPGVPIFALGYSFGALIVLELDADVRGKVLVAPPLTMSDNLSTPAGEVLVLAPTDDQFTQVEHAQNIVANWPHADFHEIQDADHFLAADAVTTVADFAETWITDRLDDRQP